MNRKVEVSRHTREGMIIVGVGTLLGFGTYFEELNQGVGQYTTAIVELEDGSVDNGPVEFIRFIDKVEAQ